MSEKNRQPEPLPGLLSIMHFVGIGGIGMSALARILKMRGYTITGSDIADSAQVAALRAMDIPVIIGHDDPALAAKANIIVTNRRAIDNAHIEIDAALANGARTIRRAELLGIAAGSKQTIAVAGSHGKSTTSGMISAGLRAIGVDPTFAIGAIMAATGTNAEPGEGAHFVVEADEFDHSFLGLYPDIAVITSVAFDHPDIYADQDEYDQAFIDFADNIRPGGTLIIAGDDAGCRRILPRLQSEGGDRYTIQTFGQQEEFDWYLHGDASSRKLTDPSGVSHGLAIRMPGVYNARNAVAAIGAIHAAGIAITQAITGVESFTGISRRFEHKGHYRGVEIIDDYAHHPDELSAVLTAAREHYPDRRIIAVHQPHTYSRTWSLLDEFADALDLADDVVLMEIYGVGETNEHGINSTSLAERMRHSVRIVQDVPEAAAAVGDLLGDDTNAVILTLGAGTVTGVGPELIRSAASLS